MSWKMKQFLLGLLLFDTYMTVLSVTMDYCDVKKITKVGCFSEYSPHSKNMTVLFSSRDKIVWDKNGFVSYMDTLTCKCATEAKKGGYSFFTIRFFGLCVVNKDYHQLIDLVHDWPWHTTDCLKGDGGYEPCDNTKNNEKCLGVNNNDFVYTYADDPWSQWSACSKTCGQGIQHKNRLFPYPPQRSRSCQTQECPKEVSAQEGANVETTPQPTIDSLNMAPPPPVPNNSPNNSPPMQSTSQCLFHPGDGESAMEWYLGDILSETECINHCIERKKEMPHINGVKMYLSSSKPGCWCEMGVQRYKSMQEKDTYRTCILELGQPCGPFNGGCNQKCKIVKAKETCSCHDGYELIDDGKTCHDINECNQLNGGCDHQCVNKEGNYECLCNAGYTLRADGKRCNTT